MAHPCTWGYTCGLLLTGSLLLLLVSVDARTKYLSNNLEAMKSVLSSLPDAPCGPVLSVETPACTIEHSTSDYEIRSYPSQTWASTIMLDMNFKEAVKQGFTRCFNYISGHNQRNETMEMAAPVKIHPIVDANGYAVSFFMPQINDKWSPPKPESTLDVNLLEEARSSKAVLGPFGGFPDENHFESMYEKLKESLERDGIEYDESTVTYVSYSSPYQTLNRKQEVWVDVFAPTIQSKSVLEEEAYNSS